MIKKEGGETRPIPTIQEVLDKLFPGEYIAEEAVLPSGEVINLEDEDGGKA